MNRTLVISIDALITADIPRLRQLPHLGRIMEGCRLRQGYPLHLSDADISLPYDHCHGLLSRPPRHLQQ